MHVKISSKIHYFYKGEWMDLKKIYKSILPTAKGNIIGSVIAAIRESKNNPDLTLVKIVFVKDRHSKNWLAVLSTNTGISDEEVIRIYGKRKGHRGFLQGNKITSGSGKGISRMQL